MASIIDKKGQQTQQTTQTTAPHRSTAVAAASTPASTPASIALKGVSENTAGKLNQYSQGYQQSGSVQAAQDYLNGVLNKKPVADAQLSQLYDRIMNREQFSYDLNGDALYQQYKDRYQNLGRQAMMDTMGNATALTGGYGSSYATTAGNQAYQQYLQQLNDIVPDLYQQAYNRYNQEGQNLLNQYNMAYGQHRDAMGDWEAERSFANSDYWNQYNADYANYQNMLNYWNQMAQLENSAYINERDYANLVSRQEKEDYYNERDYANLVSRQEKEDSYNERDYANMVARQEKQDYYNERDYANMVARQEKEDSYTERDYAYNLAMAIIKKGKMPSDDILAAAGISTSDAKKLGAKTSSGGGGRSSRSSGSSSASTSNSNGLSQYAKDVETSSRAMAEKGLSSTTVLNRINTMAKNNQITSSEAATIKKNLGLS